MPDAAAVFAAIQSDDVEQVRRLVQQDPANAAARDPGGVSALMTARYYGRQEILQVLRAALPGLDLFEATVTGDVARVREILDQHPEAVREASPDGFTGLHFAAFFGEPEVARLLLERGADPAVPAQNPSRVTPLHSAAAARQGVIAALLIERGVPIDARQAGGFTPLHSAANNGDVELARLLLAHGADRRARTDDGRDAGALARDKGHGAVVALLQQS
jgi:ankyrin repeat protein